MMDLSGLSSIYSQYAEGLSRNYDADQIKNKALSADKNSTDEQLMGVCKEFEAYFLEQVYGKMLDTVNLTETSNGANNTLLNFYKDKAIGEIAKQTVEQNGQYGLAQQLYEQMKRNYEL